MFGYVSWQSYDVARRELNVFTARAADALHDQQFDRAERYALQVYPARGRLPWTTPFSAELEGKLAGAALSTQLHRQPKHSKSVQSAAFSGDGKRVVTASDDKTVRVWDAESGKQIAVLRGHDYLLSSAAFSGDGTWVVTASNDNTARIWDVTWATLMRGDALRERVCDEKLVGVAQEFTDSEMEGPILRGIDKNDPVARNPCLRRGAAVA
jgi:hypothetical protein